MTYTSQTNNLIYFIIFVFILFILFQTNKSTENFNNTCTGDINITGALKVAHIKGSSTTAYSTDNQGMAANTFNIIGNGSHDDNAIPGWGGGSVIFPINKPYNNHVPPGIECNAPGRVVNISDSLIFNNDIHCWITSTGQDGDGTSGAPYNGKYNLQIASWFGIGFFDACYNRTNIIFDVRSGNITTTGIIKASSVVSPSDKRLKQNIKEFDSVYESIKKLTPVTYEWKEDNKNDYGLIAQEYYQIFPFANKTNLIGEEPVDETGNPKYYSVDYSKLSVILLQGLKETMSKLEETRLKLDETTNNLNNQILYTNKLENIINERLNKLENI